MTEKEYKIFSLTTKYALLIMSLSSLYILVKFTLLHIVYFPKEIPFINHEAFILILCLIFFIVSLRFKFKLSMVISFIAILLGVFNFLVFTTMTILHYRELYLDSFIYLKFKKLH